LDLLESFKANAPEFTSITFYLFTDRTADAKKYFLDKNFLNVRIVEIPNIGWPDASLFRYKIFDEYKNVFDVDILVHLDSDMLILRNPVENFKKADKKMTFVRHPGFYFDKSIRYSIFLFQNPRKILSNSLSLFRKGAIGPWDTEKTSGAYVPVSKRKNYYCGGIWFSRKGNFLDFCKLLSERTNLDASRGYTPTWHDESYLNWFASENDHNELSPLFCSDGIIESLFLEKPFIRAVDKPIIGYHGN
jgi:hypothetical protein